MWESRSACSFSLCSRWTWRKRSAYPRAAHFLAGFSYSSLYVLHFPLLLFSPSLVGAIAKVAAGCAAPHVWRGSWNCYPWFCLVGVGPHGEKYAGGAKLDDEAHDPCIVVGRNRFLTVAPGPYFSAGRTESRATGASITSSVVGARIARAVLCPLRATLTEIECSCG